MENYSLTHCKERKTATQFGTHLAGIPGTMVRCSIRERLIHWQTIKTEKQLMKWCNLMLHLSRGCLSLSLAAAICGRNIRKEMVGKCHCIKHIGGIKVPEWNNS